MATICTRIAILFETNSWKLYTFGLRHYNFITAVNHIHHDNIRRRISPEYLKDFSVSSRQWFFSTLVQLQKTQITQMSEFLRYPKQENLQACRENIPQLLCSACPSHSATAGKGRHPIYRIPTPFRLVSSPLPELD